MQEQTRDTQSVWENAWAQKLSPFLTRDWLATYFQSHLMGGRYLLYPMETCRHIQSDWVGVNMPDDKELNPDDNSLSIPEAKWGSLVKYIPGVILVLDTNGVIQDMNRSISGVPTEDILGHTVYYFLTEPIETLMRDSLKRVFEEGELVSLEIPAQLPNSDVIRMYFAHMGPIWEKEKVVGVMVIASDITNHKRAEKEFRDSEERYRRLVESAPDGILVMIDSLIVYANPAAIHMLGAPNEAHLLGHHTDEFVHEDYILEVKERTRRFTNGVPVLETFEETLVRLDGGLIDVEVVSTSIMYHGKQAVQSIVRDIGERKLMRQIEAEQLTLATALGNTAADLLSETTNLEKLLNKILKNLSQVVPFDTATIMLIESGIAKVAACRGFEERGERTEDVMGLQFVINDTPNLKVIMENGQSFSISDTQNYEGWQHHSALRWIRSNISTPIWMDKNIIGIFNLDSAKPNAFTGDHIYRLEIFAGLVANAVQNARLYQAIQANNIELERHVAERTMRLNEEKERMLSILNSSADSVIMATTDFTIEQTNPAFDEQFGYEMDELTGRSLAEVVIPEHADLLAQEFDSIWGGDRKRGRLEVIGKRKDGQIFSADLALSPVRNSDGVVTGVVCSFRDVTPQKEAEESLRNALEREREVSEMRARFVSTASHEFRTPLTSILSSSELLAAYRKRMDEDVIDHKLRNIKEQVQHMSSLLEDVLTIGRMDAGAENLHWEEIDIEQFIKDFIEDFQTGIASGHQIVFQCNGGCLVSLVDKRLLRQAIDNLISNAVKYSPDKEHVYVTLTCSKTSMQIDIQDDGIGILVADQKRIFESFHRGANAGDIQGTGLGLAIAQRSIEVMGGTLTLTSIVGEGTTFTINLPYRPVNH